MKGIKINEVYEMLESFWDSTTTYRGFIQSIAEVDCILLQLWLERYIIKLWSDTEFLHWKIQRDVLDEWDLDVGVKETSKVPRFMDGGADSSEDLFDMKTLQALQKHKTPLM